MRFVSFLSVAVLSAAPAAAQDRVDGNRLIDEVGKCRTLTDDTARLACFDRAAAPLLSAKEGGRLIVLDRQRTVERRRARFGLAMDDTPTGDVEEDALEIREVATTVASVAQSGYDRYNLTLANGSVWQTVEPLRFTPDIGSAITLKSGTLGTFKATMPGLQTIKVKRIR